MPPLAGGPGDHSGVGSVEQPEKRVVERISHPVNEGAVHIDVDVAAEVGDGLHTLIADLIAKGIISA